MRLIPNASKGVETIMRALAIIAILGLLALALVPMRGDTGDARADHLQWQASWE